MADVNIETVLFLDKVGLKQLWKHVKENDIDTLTVSVTRNNAAEQITFVPGTNGNKSTIALNLKPQPVFTEKLDGVLAADKVLSKTGTEVKSDISLVYKNNNIYLLGKTTSTSGEGVLDGKMIISSFSASDFVKDGMVKSGKIVVVPDDESTEASGQKAGTYIKLEFNTSEGSTPDPVYVNVSSLIDGYIATVANTDGNLDISEDTDTHTVTINLSGNADAAAKGWANTVTEITGDTFIKVDPEANTGHSRALSVEHATTVSSTSDNAHLATAKAVYDYAHTAVDNEKNTIHSISGNYVDSANVVSHAATLSLKATTSKEDLLAVSSNGKLAVADHVRVALKDKLGTGEQAASADHVKSNLTVSVTRSNDLGTDMKDPESFNFNGSETRTLSFRAFTAAEIDSILGF